MFFLMFSDLTEHKKNITNSDDPQLQITKNTFRRFI